MTEIARQVLKEYWGYEQFRPLQEEIITSVIEGKDTFALLPTGGGKSICYQVPAIAMEGICIVVSPLISLMMDQVDDLKKRGIKALMVNSFMSKRDIDLCLDNAVYGDFKILYLSPERLKSDLFTERFKKMKVSFVAIDEAHCISQWGYDFRPSYLDIVQLREHKDVSFLALTATATDVVARDLVEKLQLREVQKFRKSFSRSNIYFGVQKAEDKVCRAIEVMENNPGAGIIYLRNRRGCKEVAEVLRSSGIPSDYYHAGRNQDARQKVQNAWMKDEIRVVAATNAFGMGIDKSDVRFVIHWDLPDSLEAFYQEAGRAGRDGKKSISMILYRNSDVLKLDEDFKTAYPEVEFLKEIYANLANYYQLANGSKLEQQTDFDIEAFSKRFKHSKRIVFTALRQLEKFGLIELGQGFRNPSKVRIISEKGDLLHFKRENPSYETLIDHVLRTYSGIMEQAVTINERQISAKISEERSEVMRKLKFLSQSGYIEYSKHSSELTLAFSGQRLAQADLAIDQAEYLKRKEAQLERINSMKAYVQAEGKCRSAVILEYFGEKDTSERCGHCDNCQKAEFNLSEKEIHERIRASLKNQSLSMAELLRSNSNIPGEILKKELRVLLAKEVVKIEADKIRLN